ncbi:MAG TPA: helix-turn-helix transcriptional regulator [Candidatus Faecousia faecavium]|nr:helix-turn-helix transcriptional regulator [Candidatus Faecousia faecavium]
MGYKIREVREAKNISQEELSQKSGVSRSIISALENGKTNTTSKTLANIAKALGVSVDQIFYTDSV